MSATFYIVTLSGYLRLIFKLCAFSVFITTCQASGVKRQQPFNVVSFYR